MTSSLSGRIARLLLERGAVELRPSEPFRFASGILSPIYCDNRLLLSDLEGRELIVEGLAGLLARENVDQVAGVATAGIPWGAWVADRLRKPFVYVRSSTKEHGKRNLIEGRLDRNRRTGLVEDLVSTGGSVLSAAEELKREGVSLSGVSAIFSYEFPETESTFHLAELSLAVLVTLDGLLNAAIEMKMISPGEVEQVRAWRTDPRGWKIP